MKCVNIKISIIGDIIGYEKLYFYTGDRFLECITFKKNECKNIDIWVNDDEKIIISPKNKFGKTSASLKENWDLIKFIFKNEDDDTPSDKDNNKWLGRHAFYKEPLARWYYAKKVEYILDTKNENEFILEYHPYCQGVNAIGEIVVLKEKTAAELDYEVDITDINKFFLKYTFWSFICLISIYLIGELFIFEDQTFENIINMPIEHKTYGSVIAIGRLCILLLIVSTYIAGFAEYIRIKLCKKTFKEYINEQNAKREGQQKVYDMKEEKKEKELKEREEREKNWPPTK